MDNSIENWHKLASSAQSENRLLAFELAKGLAPSIQKELCYWLAQNQETAIKLKIFKLLDPAHQALFEPEQLIDLPRLQTAIEPIILLANNRNFEQKAIILKLHRKLVAVHHHRDIYIKHYSQDATCSIDEATTFFENATKPYPFSEVVKVWLGMIDSKNPLERAKAFELAQALADKIQDALVCYFFRLVHFSQAHYIYQLLQPQYQQLILELTKEASFMSFIPHSGFQGFAYTSNKQLQKIFLQVQAQNTGSFLDKIAVIKAYAKQANLTLRLAKNVVFEALNSK